MVADAECRGIRRAAQLGHLGRRQGAGRQRQANPLAGDAARAGLAADRWALAWQSAGRTPEPWRGPDVLDVLRELGATPGVEGVLVCPQGFVADHLEVLYDLDVEARGPDGAPPAAH